MKQKKFAKPGTSASFMTKMNDLTGRVLGFLGTKTFAYIIIGWFIFQVGVVATTTAHVVPPDEAAHVAQIELYAHGGWDPFIDQPPVTYYLGAIERSPNYLYHYIMSFPYRALPNSWSPDTQVVALRLVNIVFTVGGLIVFLKTLGLLTKRGIVQNMTLFMLSNTLMFVFLSGSLNYDNLLFLATSIAFYYLIKLLQKFSVLDVLKLGTAVAFALLVKFTFVPLAVMFAGVLIFRYARKLPEVWVLSKKEIKKQRKPLIIMSVVFLVFFGFFLERYGMNFVRYGSYRPKCEKVLTFDQCMESALYRRNNTFRSNKVQNIIPELDFVSQWSSRTYKTVFGIMGHKMLDESPIIRYGGIIIFGWMLIALIRFVSRKDVLIFYLLAIILVYIATLIIHNHALYERSGMFGLALQGRYVFPVLGFIFFIGNYYVDRMLNKRNLAYGMYAAIVLFVFFFSALPTFVYGPDPSWRLAAAEPAMTYLHQLMRTIIP